MRFRYRTCHNWHMTYFLEKLPIKLDTFNRQILNKLGYQLDPFQQNANLRGFIQKLIGLKIPISTIYDVGAERGNWTRMVQEMLGTKTNFYLFEPNTKYNSDLRKIGGSFYNFLLGDEIINEVNFFSLGETGDSIYKENSVKYANVLPMQIRQLTLDYLIFNKGFPVPDLLKLDTQGSELKILQGSLRFLNEVKVIVIELTINQLNNGSPLIGEVIEFLSENNFIPVHLTEIHMLSSVLAQIDIAFMNRELFRNIYGHGGFDTHL